MQLLQHTRILAAALMTLSVVGLPTYVAPVPVQLGPRPFYLVDRLAEGELKSKLAACVAGLESYEPHEFSIGHRGAALQFPEHTQGLTKPAVAWGRVSLSAT